MGTEMFPDLHLKMSKKIAQLTKVIYHLNTRNEDFDINLKAEKENHANEVEEILQDAADKINKFKAQLAKAKQNSATANALKKLRSQHEREREEAMNEFSKYKSRVQKREDSLRKEFKEKVGGMKRDLDGAKKTFKQRLKAFSEIQKKHKNNASISNAELEELKKAHKEEIDELVKTWNKKYNDMLSERMDVEDGLKAKFEADLNEAKRTISMKHAKELEQFEKHLRDQFENEKKKMSSEHEALMRKEKDVLVSKMEKLLVDLEAVRGEKINLERENESLSKQIPVLDKNILRLEHELQMQKNACDMLRKNNGASTKEMEQLLSEREKKVSALNSELTSLKAKYESQQLQMEQLKKDKKAVEAQLKKSEANVLDKDKSLKKTQSSLEKEQAKVVQLQSKLDKLNSQNSDSGKTIQDLEKKPKSKKNSLVKS